MEKMGLNQIRKEYLDFFESKGHLVLPSFSLVPQNDKSLLLINAGMAPLKPYFTGQETPPRKRVATCQKCIRTGDIERVGKTSRHATFFEMLGNFSFGDYFKKEIIPWAWEFVTGVLDIPKDRLYATIYKDDDEAYEIWTKQTDIDPSRIFRLGKEDNFWEHGAGPCGPCSEIHFDRGQGEINTVDEFVKASDEDRIIEFWNLVFTQYDKDEDGNYNKLKNPNIDTGMGLERMATIMQGVDSIFEVDTMKRILNEVCSLLNVEYGKNKDIDTSIRVITDHIRSITFMAGDGILPSNEGRGYVFRRLLRRAARHGKLLNSKEAFLYKLCDVVIDNSKYAYHEIDEKREYIKKIIKLEEERFDETIDQGIGILNEYVDELKFNNEKILSGDKAFKLYDTYGFPVELTLEILEENGMEIDMIGFEQEMKSQRERARAARDVTNYMGRDIDVYSTLPPEITTSFSGYNNCKSSGRITVIVKDGEVVQSANCGDYVSLILDNTSFYSEMGGQVGDSGIIKSNSPESKVEIRDCKKTPNGKIIHIGKVIKGTINVKDKVETIVYKNRRDDIARNHTATHLLQSALKQVLGNHVEQSGSLVTEERLRFDFTHFEQVSPEDLKKVEHIVNESILDSLEVETIETGIDEARKMGAVALFGEKYGSVVRVVKVGDISMEFCGGTHVLNSSQIGLFKIISEGGIAAGVRRIEAVTGRGALDYINNIENELNKAAMHLKTQPKEVASKVEGLIHELKIKDNEISELKLKVNANASDDIIKNARDIKGIKVVASLVELDAEGLRDLGDRLRDRLGKSVVVLGSKKDGKALFIVMASKDAVSSGINAGKIVKEVAKIAGGGGGGKPDVAQAGGKYVDKIGDALEASYDIIEKSII